MAAAAAMRAAMTAEGWGLGCVGSSSASSSCAARLRAELLAAAAASPGPAATSRAPISAPSSFSSFSFHISIGASARQRDRRLLADVVAIETVRGRQSDGATWHPLEHVADLAGRRAAALCGSGSRSRSTSRCRASQQELLCPDWKSRLARHLQGEDDTCHVFSLRRLAGGIGRRGELQRRRVRALPRAMAKVGTTDLRSPPPRRRRRRPHQQTTNLHLGMLEKSEEKRDWESMMREIEKGKSATKVLQARREKLSKGMLVGALMRFKQLRYWQLLPRDQSRGPTPFLSSISVCIVICRNNFGNGGELLLRFPSELSTGRMILSFVVPRLLESGLHPLCVALRKYLGGAILWTLWTLRNSAVRRAERLTPLKICEWMLAHSKQWEIIQQDFNTLISAYAKLGKWKEAEAALKKMNARGLSPTVGTYTALIDAYGRSGQATKGEDVLRSMEAEGLWPTAMTYQTLIQGYGRVGDTANAERVFREALGDDEVQADGDQTDANADRLTDEELSKQQHKEGERPTAWAQHAKQPVDAQFFNTMIDVYTKTGMKESALFLFRDMQRRKVMPDKVTYDTLINMYAKEGDHVKAEEVLREMQQAGFSPNTVTMTGLLSAYGKSGRVEEASGVFNELLQLKLRPTVRTWGALINACCQAGEWEQAEEVYRKMKASGCHPNLVVVSTLIKGYMKCGEIKKAEAFVENVKSMGLEPDAMLWTTLIGGYAKAGDVRKALSSLKLMEAAGFPADAATYNVVLAMYGDCQEYEAAAGVFEEMVARGFRPEEGAKRSLLRACKDEEQRQDAMLLLQDHGGVTFPQMPAQEKEEFLGRMWNEDQPGSLGQADGGEGGARSQSETVSVVEASDTWVLLAEEREEEDGSGLEVLSL
ncbi:hypothetical protein CBR_g53495 [Chara braunii]|uniref:Pentacotripeptide-repeat region of PRORP domain-containing protein n=1 Tax=Chara braunii TaxID=69332 RepID=A0A388MAS5_CHABU|nr:hypothetical protein CBR_g53495 [Chara braunii]|eukprot:GBG91681.1 hypothetical protein CBR_g53495 [Chara braunii]